VARFEQDLNFGIPTTKLDGTMSSIEFDITIEDQFYSIGSSDAQVLVNMFDTGNCLSLIEEYRDRYQLSLRCANEIKWILIA